MNKVIVSAGILALGAVGAYDVRADMAAGSEKPWTINGTLRGFYDDNYNTQPSGTNKVASFGFEVHPSISVKLSEGPDTFSAAYYYSLYYYGARPNSKIDQDHQFELAWNHRLNTTDALSVVETFVDSQEPAILNSTSPGSVPLRANGDNFHNTFAPNYEFQVNNLLGFVFGYANDWYRYNGSQDPNSSNAGYPSYGTLLNRIEHKFTVDSRWTIDDETTAVFGYSFQWVDHMSGGSINEAGLPYVPGTARNLYSHYIYVGADHNFTDTLKTSARAGIVYMDFYNEDINSITSGVTAPNSVSPYVDLSVIWDYRDDGNLKVGFTQSQNTTDVNATFNEITSSLYGYLTQTLTPVSPNLTASLTGQFEYASYNGGTLDGGHDEIYLVGLNLAYQFNKYFSTEVGYNYDKLQSTQYGRNYDRNRVYIGATASY